MMPPMQEAPQEPFFSWCPVQGARCDTDDLKTQGWWWQPHQPSAASPGSTNALFLGPESQGTARKWRRGLTSPAPALRTALMKDMMAVFRFTSSRYRPRLRSSSFSRVWMERQDRKEGRDQDPTGPASHLCSHHPNHPECCTHSLYPSYPTHLECSLSSPFPRSVLCLSTSQPQSCLIPLHSALGTCSILLGDAKKCCFSTL